MGQFVKVARLADIREGEGHAVSAGEHDIALFKVRGQVYAIGNACIHQGGPLADGWCDGLIVSCPWHGWEYDVTTGACTLAGGVSVPRYAVKVEGEDVLVEV